MRLTLAKSSLSWSRALTQAIPAEMRGLLGWVMALFGVGLIYSLINHWTYQYPGFNYLPMRWIILSPFVLGLFWVAVYAQDKTPRLALFTLIYTVYFFVFVAFAVMVNGLQYTPFHPIDATLLRWDQKMGFDTVALMRWTAMHPVIKKTFESTYEFLNFEIILIPLLLPWIFSKERVFQLLKMMVIAFLIGTTIYYFFPTAAPVSVLHSAYFLDSEQATALKFYQIHHYLPVTTGDGGLIAFPSFHVIWAILLCYALRGKKILFYPALAINFILILSTLFLGWHYLIDVIAGLLLSLLFIISSREIDRHVDDVPLHQ